LLNRPTSTPNFASGGGFDFEPVEIRSGFVSARITGKDIGFFSNEAGGHRWQRVPKNDDRVQTSTVTVAVLPEPTETQLHIREQDLEWSTCRGSGAGGQHRNKTESAVQLRHIPTGTTVRCESERSQSQNKRTALATLRARIWEAQQNAGSAARSIDRRQQVGSGMRGDKRRTIRADGVVDHITGKRWKFKDYVRANW